MAAMSHIYTLRYAAEILEQDEDVLLQLYISFEPEDGAIFVSATT